MNSLSWLLYLIDVIGNAKVAFGILCIFGAVAIAFVVAVTLEDSSYNRRTAEQDMEVKRTARQWALAGFAWVITISLVLILMPSRNTLYAIAASQYGEKIAANEQVQEITGDAAKALHKWIKDQLKD